MFMLGFIIGVIATIITLILYGACVVAAKDEINGGEK